MMKLVRCYDQLKGESKQQIQLKIMKTEMNVYVGGETHLFPSG